MPQPLALPQLDAVRVASPCSMRWDDLTPIAGKPDSAIRNCAACGLNVYNVAGLSREEAGALFAEHAASGARLCAALRRRADGTILTRDCPVGRAAIRKRIRVISGRIAAAFLLLGTTAALAVTRRAERFTPRLRSLQPIHDATSRLNDLLQTHLPASLQPDEVDLMVMGEIYVPPAGNVPECASDMVYRSL